MVAAALAWVPPDFFERAFAQVLVHSRFTWPSQPFRLATHPAATAANTKGALQPHKLPMPSNPHRAQSQK